MTERRKLRWKVARASYAEVPTSKFGIDTAQQEILVSAYVLIRGPGILAALIRAGQSVTFRD